MLIHIDGSSFCCYVLFERDTTPPTSDKTYLVFRGVLNDSSLYSALDPTSRQSRCVDLHLGSSTESVMCSLVYITLDPKASKHPF
jgi:hypothetical protein